MPSEETQPALTEPLIPDWSAVERQQPVAANLFATQLGVSAAPGGVPDSITVTLAYVQPPLFLGPPDRVATQREELRTSGLPAVPVCRVILSRHRAEELRDLLQTAIDQYDSALSDIGEKGDG